MKRFILVICMNLSLLGAYDASMPQFEKPIYLFKLRFFDIKKMLEDSGIEHNFTQEQLEVLQQVITPCAIFANTGRQVPEIGFDQKRIESYSGQLVEPKFIVITFSGCPTLEETIESLQKNRFAHNFLIDDLGKIYPVTGQAETIEQALEHRPFSVGVSRVVVDGYLQICDMNACSISISLVGSDTQPATQEQIKALITLVEYLSDHYKIKPEHVSGYGRYAWSKNGYGRRNVAQLLPWQELAEYGLTLWPTDNDQMTQKIIHDVFTFVEKEKSHAGEKKELQQLVFWMSMALVKVGFVCPLVTDAQNPAFMNALQTFQQHFQCDDQTGNITCQTVFALNSILVQHELSNPHLKSIEPRPFGNYLNKKTVKDSNIIKLKNPTNL